MQTRLGYRHFQVLWAINALRRLAVPVNLDNISQAIIFEQSIYRIVPGDVATLLAAWEDRGLIHGNSALTDHWWLLNKALFGGADQRSKHVVDPFTPWFRDEGEWKRAVVFSCVRALEGSNERFLSHLTGMCIEAVRDGLEAPEPVWDFHPKTRWPGKTQSVDILGDQGYDLEEIRVLTVLFLMQNNDGKRIGGFTLKEIFRSPFFKGLARPQFTRIVGKKLLNTTRWDRPPVRRHPRQRVSPLLEGAHALGWVKRPHPSLSTYELTLHGDEQVQAALR